MTQLLIAFSSHRKIAHGGVAEVARAAHAAERAGEPVLAFDARTSAPVDFDLRGSADEAAARAEGRFAELAPARGRGRPKLGVVAHEVTLLPRHWDWLRGQPGGASVALRKLIETASRDPRQIARAAQDAAYKFMHAVAGDLPDFEEASRALFARDGAGFSARTAAWPADVRDHLEALAEPAFAATGKPA